MKTSIKLILVLLSATLFTACPSGDDDMDMSEPPVEEFTLYFNVETNEDQMAKFSHHKMVVYNDAVWSVGGYNSYNTGVHSEVWKSDDGIAWVSQTSDQFAARKDHSLTVYDGKMWVIGGFTETTPGSFTALSDVWYSTDGSSWTLATDEPIGFPSVGTHAATVFNGQLFIIRDGGNEGMPGCTVWSTADGINWTRQTDNAFSYREGFSATVFNGELYVIGGLNESTYYNEIWKSPDGFNWTKVEVTGDIFSPRAYGEAVVYKNKLWVLGGKNASSSTGLGLWYSEDGSEWFSYEPLPSEDGLHYTSALNFDDSIWVFGGMHQEDGEPIALRTGTINSITQD